MKAMISFPGQLMDCKVALFIASLMILSGSFAVAQDDKQIARSAWAKAVSLAKQRNAGNTCEVDAFQKTILSQLRVAVKISPRLRNEIVQAESNSAKALRKALAGNLMFLNLTGKMQTPKQVAQAMVGSIWYSNDGGVMGSRSILYLERNQARELVVDTETYKRRPVLWTYKFDANTGELTLSNRATSRRYKLEKTSLDDGAVYDLKSLKANEIGYSNEPDDCSA
jgi:hypothetical protein